MLANALFDDAMLLTFKFLRSLVEIHIGSTFYVKQNRNAFESILGTTQVFNIWARHMPVAD